MQKLKNEMRHRYDNVEKDFKIKHIRGKSMIGRSSTTDNKSHDNHDHNEYFSSSMKIFCQNINSIRGRLGELYFSLGLINNNDIIVLTEAWVSAYYIEPLSTSDYYKRFIDNMQNSLFNYTDDFSSYDLLKRLLFYCCWISAE